MLLRIVIVSLMLVMTIMTIISLIMLLKDQPYHYHVTHSKPHHFYFD